MSTSPITGRFAPLRQLLRSRIRLFLREPAAIFWVYGFPIILMATLGMAFREGPPTPIVIDLIGQGDLHPWQQKLAGGDEFKVNVAPDDWQKRLQSGKTDLVVEITSATPSGFRFWQEPHRAESRLARSAVEAALLRSENKDWTEPQVEKLQQVGSRYIDFLLPGMLGMGLMGGGLWGVGFVVVDMRVRKLLKRFLATPMRRSDFLLSLMGSRLLFTLVDVLVLLVFGYFAFGVHCQGSYLQLAGAVLLGGAAFAGIGLLVASRAETLETVSGLMNLVMLPMWVLSGVFFSAERFPEAVQPLINLLPLTALNQMLRGIMLEATTLPALWPQTLLLAAYAVITFAIALRVFRWK
jgi:ABC-type multidrug transport system permease subunit